MDERETTIKLYKVCSGNIDSLLQRRSKFHAALFVLFFSLATGVLSVYRAIDAHWVQLLLCIGVLRVVSLITRYGLDAESFYRKSLTCKIQVLIDLENSIPVKLHLRELYYWKQTHQGIKNEDDLDRLAPQLGYIIRRAESLIRLVGITTGMVVCALLLATFANIFS